MLGTFPPSEKRWSMKFYYPNFINDMWRIFGLIFFNDKEHFVDAEAKTFRLDLLIPFLKEQGIALFDTATRIRRTTGTASDKTWRLWKRQTFMPCSASCPNAGLWSQLDNWPQTLPADSLALIVLGWGIIRRLCSMGGSYVSIVCPVRRGHIP